MSHPYLGWLIREQIDRARSLKASIPDRQRHAALAQLAAMCNGVLEEQVRQLRQERALLDGAGDAGAAGALGAVRHCTRAIAEIEWYGIPPLHCQSDQAVFLNDVLSSMHREIGLPQPLPVAACTANGYYFTHLPTGTIYVPLSEASFLLHMPDFYHELGHLLYYRLGSEAKYGPIRDGVAGARGAVDRYYLRQTHGTYHGAAPRQHLRQWSGCGQSGDPGGYWSPFAISSPCLRRGPRMRTPTCTWCPRLTWTCTALTCSNGRITPLARLGCECLTSECACSATRTKRRTCGKNGMQWRGTTVL